MPWIGCHSRLKFNRLVGLLCQCHS